MYNNKINMESQVKNAIKGRLHLNMKGRLHLGNLGCLD